MIASTASAKPKGQLIWNAGTLRFRGAAASAASGSAAAFASAPSAAPAANPRTPPTRRRLLAPAPNEPVDPAASSSPARASFELLPGSSWCANLRCRRSSRRLAASATSDARAASSADFASAVETFPSSCCAWSDATLSAFATENRFGLRAFGCPLAPETLGRFPSEDVFAVSEPAAPAPVEEPASGVRAFVGFAAPPAAGASAPADVDCPAPFAA